MVISRKVLFGGTATPTVWTISKVTGADTMISTPRTGTANFWGLAPAPKTVKGTCPG